MESRLILEYEAQIRRSGIRGTHQEVWITKNTSGGLEYDERIRSLEYEERITRSGIRRTFQVLNTKNASGGLEYDEGFRRSGTMTYTNAALERTNLYEKVKEFFMKVNYNLRVKRHNNFQDKPEAEEDVDEVPGAKSQAKVWNSNWLGTRVTNSGMAVWNRHLQWESGS